MMGAPAAPTIFKEEHMEPASWPGVANSLITAGQLVFMAWIALQNTKIHKAVNSTAEKQVLKIDEQSKLIETLTAQLAAVTDLVKKGNGERGIK